MKVAHTSRGHDSHGSDITRAEPGRATLLKTPPAGEDESCSNRQQEE
jgi:hypothetical protein